MSLISVGRNYMQETMPLDSFSGSVKGLGNLGESVQKAALVIDDFRERMMAVQDEASAAKADRLYGEAFAQHEKEMATKPPQEWTSLWQAKESALHKQLDDLPMSRQGRRKMENWHQRFFANSTISLGSKANKQIIDDARMEVLTGFNRHLANGQYESAMSLLSSSNVFSDAEKDKYGLEAELQQREDNNISMMTADPDALIKDIDAGKHDDMPEKERQQLRNRARQVKHQQLIEADDQLDQMILTGDIKTDEEIRAFGEEHNMPERRIASHMNSLREINDNTIEGKARIYAAHVEIQTDISKYDPETDVNDKTYLEIKDKIRTFMPQGQRQELLDDLAAIRKEGRKSPAQEIRGNVFSQIRTLEKNGFFGKNDTAQRKLNTTQKSNNLMDQFRAYQKQSGQSLTQADADKWLMDQVRGDVVRVFSNGVIKDKEGETIFYPKAKAAMPAGVITFDNVNKTKAKTKSQLLKEIDDELELPEE